MSENGCSGARLDEFDADEWFDVMKRIRPDLTREEFDELWAKFQRDKRKRATQ
jgi:hypothetical protein